MSNIIHDQLRDPPPVMILDMGLGSREQSLPAHDPEPMLVIAKDQGKPADLPGA